MPEITKTCSRCGRELPANSDFYFRDSQLKYGLTSACKECMGKKFTNKITKCGYKICFRCKRELPLEMFHKNKYHKDGLNNKCKDCVSECGKERYQKIEGVFIPGTVKICYKCKRELPIEMFSKQRHSKDGVSGKCKECTKQYAKENRSIGLKSTKKYYNSHKKQHAELVKRYKEQNKEKMADIQRRSSCRYKSKKLELKLDIDLTQIQWDKIKSAFGNRCAYCGKKLPLEQEHFIPLSKGGEYTHNNIIPACKSCNCSKRDKYFSEWYPEYKHYSKKREKQILNYLGYKGEIQQLSLMD